MVYLNEKFEIHKELCSLGPLPILGSQVHPLIFLLDCSRSGGLTWFSPLALDPVTQEVKEKNKNIDPVIEK